jgi:hypothetical protein
METNIKQLTITGQAAEEYSRPRRSQSGTSRRKKVVVRPEDDNEVPPDDEITSQIKKMNVVKAQEQVAPKQVAAPVSLLPKPEPTPQPQIVSQDSATPQKVVLKPPKQQRVRLQPKAVGGGASTAQAIAKPVVNQTRKARRIKLTVANLNHRFTRAKKVKEHTEKEPVDSVREYLIKKGVIQAKSRAPEKMLRSMYADFMLLKDQAL